MMDLETTCHVSCVMCHISFFNISETVRTRDLQFVIYNIHHICHVSRVTCQVSQVNCHESCVTNPVPQYFVNFIYKVLELIGGGSLINRALLLFFLLNCVDPQHLLFSAFSGPI